ncbi:MAG TPA: hypothetical protein VGQ87_02185 [Patescibacteria group bacterium]|jgi:general secretion pathway protein G|nr:hypothetical protein [Patescibacteria group bacterium]
MQELLDYIRAARANGDSDETITANLKSAGWDESMIAQGMEELRISPGTPVHPTMGSKFGWGKILRYGKYPLAVLIVLGLGFAGFKTYSYFVSNPDRVWNDTSKNMTGLTSAHFKLEASYSETVPKDLQGSDFGLFGDTGDLKFSVTGKGSMAIKQADADYDMDSTVNIKYGSLSIGLDFLSRKLGDNVYYRMDNNPFTSFFGGSGNTDKTKQWLKINLKDSKNSEMALLDVQKEQILQAFKKAKLMHPTKLLDSQTLDGVSTWHYQAELNKQELKNYFEDLQTIFKPEELKNLQAIVDKLEFKKLELWIGKSDHLIHQALIESNSPSLVALSLGSARNKSRDARRLADIRQIQTGLELFYSDNNRYPAALKDQPLATDGTPAFNTYIYVYPTAPTPADGSCTDEGNKYYYQQVNNGADYKLTFCLGSSIGGYDPGITEVNTKGHTTIIPGTDAGSSDSLEGIPFNASIQVKLNLSDFNQEVKIEEPQDAYDAGMGARDARRVADIRQIQTALELFYNDNNRYPVASDGQPLATDGQPGNVFVKNTFSTYISPYPTAPTPADGSCTEDSNKYVYTQINNGTNYKLTFCLGSDTGGYGAGPLTANASGILGIPKPFGQPFSQ